MVFQLKFALGLHLGRPAARLPSIFVSVGGKGHPEFEAMLEHPATLTAYLKKANF
jgi:hypothetical protein